MKKLLVVLMLFAVPAFAQTYEAEVSWTDNSDNEDGFRVEVATSQVGPWTQIGDTFAPDVTVLVDPGPYVSGDSRCWRVITYNAAGDAAPSTPACAAVLEVPNPASGVTVIFRPKN